MASIDEVEAPMDTEAEPLIDVEPVVAALRPVRNWIIQCSAHLSHIETRAMWADVLGHEMMRHYLQAIENFSPPPRGDWGWLLRKAEDISMHGVRQLIKHYHSSREEITSFITRALRVVRLFLEEAFHRSVLEDSSGMRKRALCSLMVTMRNFEAEMILSNELGVFCTFTEEAVLRMARRINAEEDTSIEICPSFEVAMQSEMRLEVVSLMRLRPVPRAISMTQAEVRALIGDNKGLMEHEVVPGSEGVSAFKGLFEEA